jgi:hypothetical protein
MLGGPSGFLSSLGTGLAPARVTQTLTKVSLFLKKEDLNKKNITPLVRHKKSVLSP